MTIRFRCPCGRSLRADDDEVGLRITCRDCGDSIRVPDDDADDDRPSRRRPRNSSGRRRVAEASGVGMYLWIGGGVLLLALIVGLAFAFSRSSSSAADEALIGEWENDPNMAAGNAPFMLKTKFSFRADHTYKFSSIMELEGRWKVVERDGDRLKVRLVHQIFGMDQDDPPTATITIVDKDHLEFSANERSMQLSGRFRRVGTGPPVPDRPQFQPPDLGPMKLPNPGVMPPGPQVDGAVPDCEVLWGGSWFKAKIVKKENDRWFIHYVGWANTWDEWVGKDRIRFLK